MTSSDDLIVLIVIFSLFYNGVMYILSGIWINQECCNIVCLFEIAKKEIIFLELK